MDNMRTGFAAAIMLLVAGCGSIQNVNDTMQRGDDTASQGRQLAEAMRQQKAAAPRPAVVFSDEQLVDLRPMPIAKQRRSADSLSCNGMSTVTYAPATSIDILEFGQQITKLCGFSVRVTADALAAVSGQINTTGMGGAAGSNNQAQIPAPGQPLPNLPGLPGNAQGAGARGISAQGFGGMSSGYANGLINNLRWDNKPVEGLFDVVTSRLGLSWKKVDGVVTIFYLDTRTFHIYAVPGGADTTSVVQSGTTTAAGVSGGISGQTGGAGGGVSGSSGSTQTTTVTNKTAITDDIIANIKSMLTPNVGRISEPPKSAANSGGGFSTGAVTITDTPEVLDRIAIYLKSENDNITKQVLLNVKVLSVTLTDKDSLGIDWTLVYKSVSGYGLGLKNQFTGDTNAVSGTVSILDNATGGAGRFAGSSLIVQALAQQGRVSTVTSPSVTTLNLQPVPVQVARQTSYLASVQTTSTAQVGSTTSLTPGTVTTGFNMNLLPVVMPDNNLLLQYSINLSALQRLRQVSSGGNTIEIPEVDNRIFSQKVRLKSGETLVLSGFEQSIDNGNRQGIGRADFWLLGGGVGTDNRRDVIVVLITPVIQD